MHAALKSEEVVVSEKVVCRIMKEEGLIAKRPGKRKYSSCKGEIAEGRILVNVATPLIGKGAHDGLRI